jgi:putative spermidine/putrescine transport system ATP-binding protein
VRKWSREEIRKRVAWGLDLVQLSGLEDRRVDQLSGGQQQRVALARAIVFEPRIILMDEPLSALDKQLREQMQIELRRLHERLGATTVYVTHDQREALTLSDRVAVLDYGRIIQLGPPQELYEHPANRFVADFVGETTLLPVDRAGPHQIRLAGQVFRSERRVPKAGPLYLAIRTEKLLVADGHLKGQENLLTGTVSRAVYQGESVRLFVELGDGAVVSLRRLCQGGAAVPLPQEREPINLLLPPENVVVVTD